MFKALIGNLFTSEVQTLVNTVNCVGVMGKGVALEFKERFPSLFSDYAERCTRKQLRLGEPYVYRATGGKLVVNFPTKGHWRSPSRLADIESGLDYFVKHYAAWGITSIAFPPLGCGNGGLEWAEVGPLAYAKLHRLPILIEIYAPYGTPKHELTEEFLARPAQMSLGGEGRKQDKLNPEWVVLVEVLRELGQQPYANPVGRTIFQKICYVLTEMGVHTGFQFGKGSYGPFADEVKLALHEFANRNWLQEEQLGQMMALRVGEQYEQDRAKFADVIQPHQKKIAKAVDLFSRIKNTAQAEEVLTVFFASRQLKKAKPQQEVAEQELYDYILDWKKAWATDQKKSAVASAIRNLVVLGWMKLSFSESMPESA
ncbi:MAG: macro domain-containing protein [Candidatus Accumulibacter sp.]|uniref:type II toxin-antitoxin system antitoxin DNA ADP-ribosyl glycohydrolase DarG n=1 Tax=Accumulibacter sp. TaxID=2053492 RepID=UPI001DC04DC9|nr:macro domain-containing protein [Accumulibacter sp.]MCB1942304.1 macro domain-containing protein [Accumulibacter sp.]MCP5248876.1 macro domain-containing protein [Accumulibacter sp.]